MKVNDRRRICRRPEKNRRVARKCIATNDENIRTNSDYIRTMSDTDLAAMLTWGSILTSSSGGIKSRSISLKYHIDNTLNIISTYQPDIKSSDLRSSSASLYSVLSNTSRELTDYLIGNFNYADGSETYQTDFENASMNSAILESDLFNAKINGILDKVYASKMAYEISSIMSEENTIYDSTDDAYFQSILSASYQSLETLYPNFNN